MNYVISDVHGCRQLFLRMLEQICFSDTDTLYLLGDVADRGPDGIPMLLDVMGRRNVIMLLGNHEDMFRRVIRDRETKPSVLNQYSAERTFRNWTERNGGDITWRDYLALPEEKQKKIKDFLNSLRHYVELKLNGRRFLLIHAGVGEYAKNKRPELCELRDLIWTRMDYNEIYYEDRYLVTGHTPTLAINPDYKGKIFRENNHIVVDCGAVYTGTMGCFCLDTMEEIYVS